MGYPRPDRRKLFGGSTTLEEDEHVMMAFGPYQGGVRLNATECGNLVSSEL